MVGNYKNRVTSFIKEVSSLLSPANRLQFIRRWQWSPLMKLTTTAKASPRWVTQRKWSALQIWISEQRVEMVTVLKRRKTRMPISIVSLLILNGSFGKWGLVRRKRRSAHLCVSIHISRQKDWWKPSRTRLRHFSQRRWLRDRDQIIKIWKEISKSTQRQASSALQGLRHSWMMIYIPPGLRHQAHKAPTTCILASLNCRDLTTSSTLVRWWSQSIKRLISRQQYQFHVLSQSQLRFKRTNLGTSSPRYLATLKLWTAVWSTLSLEVSARCRGNVAVRSPNTWQGIAIATVLVRVDRDARRTLAWSEVMQSAIITPSIAWLTLSQVRLQKSPRRIYPTKTMLIWVKKRKRQLQCYQIKRSVRKMWRAKCSSFVTS